MFEAHRSIDLRPFVDAKQTQSCTGKNLEQLPRYIGRHPASEVAAAFGVSNEPPRLRSSCHRPAVHCHTATLALAGECRQKGRRLPAQTCENVSAFGMFFDEEPACVPAWIDEVIGG